MRLSVEHDLRREHAPKEREIISEIAVFGLVVEAAHENFIGSKAAQAAGEGGREGGRE